MKMAQSITTILTITNTIRAMMFTELISQVNQETSSSCSSHHSQKLARPLDRRFTTTDTTTMVPRLTSTSERAPHPKVR